MTEPLRHDQAVPRNRRLVGVGLFSIAVAVTALAWTGLSLTRMFSSLSLR